MSTVTIMRGAEPWGSEGDHTGVLFVHGFTGSPQSMRYWAEGVAREGRTVLVPRLPGHGTTAHDMQGTTPVDWVGEAEMSLRGLSERCDRIFVCGLSMGGTITLDLAARFHELVTGIVLVNATVFTKDPRARLAPILGRFPLFVKAVANDVADPNTKELAYDKVPTKAAAAFLKYQEQVKRRLPDVRCPTLVFTSRNDHVVHPGNGPYILEHVATTSKEIVYLERSYHVATIDFDKDIIVDRTNGFIKEHTS